MPIAPGKLRLLACLLTGVLCSFVAYQTCVAAALKIDRSAWVGRPVVTVLRELHSKELEFVYSSQLLPDSLRVTEQPVADEPLAIAKEILAAHGLSLSQVTRGIYVVKRDTGNERVVSVQGHVVGARDGAPLRDVHLELQPGNRVVSSNANGEFVIDRLSRSASLAHYRLHARSAGFKSADMEIDASGTQQADFRLEPFVAQIDATIVTGQRYPFGVKAAENSVPLSGGPLISQSSMGEDPIRALARLPGIVQNGASGALNIRGGATNEALILFDGFPLRQAFHIPGYRSLLSIFDPGVVSTIDVYTGGMPARYGGRMSGVLDIQTIDALDSPQHSLGASFLGARARVATALSDRSDALTAARYGAVGYLKDAIEPAVGHPSYADAFNRVHFQFGASTDVSINALLSRDALNIHRDGFDENSNLQSQLAYIWLHSSTAVGDNGTWSNWLGHTHINAERAGDVNSPQIAVGELSENRRSEIWDARSMLAFSVADSHWLEFGGEWNRGTAAYQYDSEVQFAPLIAARFGIPANRAQSTTLNPSRDDVAVFASDRWRISPRFTSQVGLRATRGRASVVEDHTVVDPRVSLVYNLTSATGLRTTWGRVHQFDDVSEFVLEDRLGINPEIQRTDYTTLGIEQQIMESTVLRVEAFRKEQNGVPARFQNFLNSPSLLPELSFDRVSLAPRAADMHGVELYLQQSGEVWSWRLAYSWSQATETIGNREFARDWDQRNIATLGVEWRKGPWLLNGAATVRSGRPTTDITNLPQGGIAIGPLNGDRIASYFGVDVRAAWRKTVSKGEISAVLQVTNLLNHRNECCSEIGVQDDSAGQPHLYVKSGQSTPLVPWAGVAWDF